MTSVTLKADYTVPLAGFASPRYIDNDPVNGSIGALTGKSKAVALFLTSATAVATIVAEVTADNNGVLNWVPVVGKRIDDLSGALGPASGNQKCFIFPTFGKRIRFRVTALTTADLTASIVHLEDMTDLSIGAAAAALASGQNVIGGVYEAPSTAALAGITPVVAAAAAASLIGKAAAGNLYGFNVKAIDGAVAQKLLLLNSATVPADGAVVPLKAFDMPAAGTLSVTFNPPIRFSAGIVLALSSAVTPYTKTLAVAANFAFLEADVA